LVAGLTGLRPEAALRWRKARLHSPLGPCGDRETFVRGTAVDDGVVPVSNQDSSAQKMLANADILIRRRAGALAAVSGETVSVLDF
jgi:molybdopterin molybdotransferase